MSQSVILSVSCTSLLQIVSKLIIGQQENIDLVCSFGPSAFFRTTQNWINYSECRLISFRYSEESLIHIRRYIYIYIYLYSMISNKKTFCSVLRRSGMTFEERFRFFLDLLDILECVGEREAHGVRQHQGTGSTEYSEPSEETERNFLRNLARILTLSKTQQYTPWIQLPCPAR